MKSSNWKNGVRAKLTDRQLEKVSRLALARTEAISRNPMRWVPNDQIVALDPEALEQSGFRRFLRTEDLPFDLRDLNAEALESAEIASRIKKGKPRPKSHGVMPSANVFEHTVAAYMKGASPASREGAIKLLELNAQFGSAQKATTYKTGFRLIVEPFHIGFWSEVDFGFLQKIGKDNGLGYWVSRGNGRNPPQCVGITAHPRFTKIAGPFEITAVAEVQGIPNLRPALVVILEDQWSGLIIRAVAVHLKSMMGGAEVTAPVRFQQCEAIAAWLGPNAALEAPPIKNLQVRPIFKNKLFGRAVLDHAIVSAVMPLCPMPDDFRALPIEERIPHAVTAIGGDLNFKHGMGLTDNLPLIEAGYVDIDPDDTTATQEKGGRLDAIYESTPKRQSGCDADVEDESGEVEPQDE